MARPQRSDVWKFLERNKPKDFHATCNACGKVFHYNGSTTSNLWAHPRIYESASCTTRTTAVRCTGAGGNLRDGIASYFPAKSIPAGRSSQLHQLLADWIVKDLRPCRIVEDVGLRDFVRALCPGYKMPSRTHIAELINEVTNRARAR